MKSRPFVIALALCAVTALVFSVSIGPGNALAGSPCRGDADEDGALAITDAIFILNFLFLGGRAPACSPIADADGDGVVNITDGVFVLGHLFLGGPAPPPLTPAEIVECGGEDPAVGRGREVYLAPSENPRNAFACSTCHPVEESDLRFAASSLHDALRRPHYKLAKVENFIDAANTCRVHWMETFAWTTEDAAFQDLVAYLESISPDGDAPPVVYTIKPPVTFGPSDGDAQAGCELFHRSCVVCHGPGAVGSELGPSLVAFPLSEGFIRAKVRLSGPDQSVYEGLAGDGTMPFWSEERLSDEELEDLVAYILGEPPLDVCGER